VASEAATKVSFRPVRMRRPKYTNRAGLVVHPAGLVVHPAGPRPHLAGLSAHASFGEFRLRVVFGDLCSHVSATKTEGVQRND
jgi:hypothetical protein